MSIIFKRVGKVPYNSLTLHSNTQSQWKSLTHCDCLGIPKN